MPIIDLPIIMPGQIGVKPVVRRMVTTDDYNTITAPGYLTQQNLEGVNVEDGDILDVTFDADLKTKIGTNSRFAASVANGVLTLFGDIEQGYQIFHRITDLKNAVGGSTIFFTAEFATLDSIVVLNALDSGVTNTTDPILAVEIPLPENLQVNYANVQGAAVRLKFAYTLYVPK